MSLRSVVTGALDETADRGPRRGTDPTRPPRGSERLPAAAPATPAADGGVGAPPAAPPQLALDPIACVGHGLCAELFPEGVVLDDWGFPVLLPEAQDPALRAHARRAAKACPALALKLRAGRERAAR